jgi:hypothetical protein
MTRASLAGSVPRPPPLYPPGSVRVLLGSDLVTPATREALRMRLAVPVVLVPLFFSSAGFGTLCAVCDRLIPQPERPRPIDLCGTLDTRMASGEGDGWRYAHMPDDSQAQTAGLAGIEQTALAMFAAAFTVLGSSEQDEVLRAVQDGTAAGPIWLTLDAKRYFEELLAQVVDIYYSHPLGAEEIGYAGMADAHGWQHVGLGDREAHEPAVAVLAAAA